MISEDKYLELVESVLDRSLKANVNQKSAVMSSVDDSLFIVAGPGSGKTTVLVLKILKYIFVDDISPSEIFVTTFTKKAANELKSRTILWANQMCNELSIDYINFESMMIGTIDSIAEEVISNISDIKIIDNFASSAIMMHILLTNQRNNDKRLKQFFKKLNNNQGSSASDINRGILAIKERIMYDMIDINLLERDATREKVVYDIIGEYYSQLNDRNIMDYSLLEKTFHDLLSENKIESLEKIKVLLIDEYQDSNYLQEQIYFKLASYTTKNNGNITVVGDDDQSLYRFRGAKITLFTNYVKRIKRQLNISPKVIFLQKNYRSTINIINFINDYVKLDKRYQKSRITNKPQISYSPDTYYGLPIFGMFRNNIEELSTDLSNFIYDIKTNNIREVKRKDKNYVINLGKNPSLAVLTNSPKEISSFNKKRLPFYIRESLSYKDEELIVFNPRGQNIESTEVVSLICGIILMSIDPKSKIQSSIENLPLHTKKSLNLWRKQAQIYMQENDLTYDEREANINLIELLSDISNQLNDLLLESNENKIYHDVIKETITQTYDAINNDGILTTQQVFWHILIPIATGAIDIDDDMFEFNLEDNVNIMSIHQSKGLEFDVVIVDVGSDIYNNQKGSSFKRFPVNGGFSYNLDKYLEEYSPLGIDEDLSGRDEAFNDLIRRYFVAYSRPKMLMVLVGLSSMKEGYRGDFQDNIKIENIATGWSRDKVWHWEDLNNLIQL